MVFNPNLGIFLYLEDHESDFELPDLEILPSVQFLQAVVSIGLEDPKEVSPNGFPHTQLELMQ